MHKYLKTIYLVVGFTFLFSLTQPSWAAYRCEGPDGKLTFTDRPCNQVGDGYLTSKGRGMDQPPSTEAAPEEPFSSGPNKAPNEAPSYKNPLIDSYKNLERIREADTRDDRLGVGKMKTMGRTIFESYQVSSPEYVTSRYSLSGATVDEGEAPILPANFEDQWQTVEEEGAHLGVYWPEAEYLTWQGGAFGANRGEVDILFHLDETIYFLKFVFQKAGTRWQLSRIRSVAPWPPK